MARKRSIRDIDLRPGSTVLVRVDYNVPFDDASQTISDDSRIVGSLPTIQYLRERQCTVVLCAHRGRPGGRRNPRESLAPIAGWLTELIGSRVLFVRDCVGEDVESAVADALPGDLMLLENLRFHPGEEANDPDFARRLARLADYYVNDGFGAAHRGHASTVGVAEFLPAAAGLLMEREIGALARVTECPRHPYAVVIGGAKVADKMPVLENLADVADVFLIGGGMASTFLAGQGRDVTGAGADDRDLTLIRRALERAASGDFRACASAGTSSSATDSPQRRRRPPCRPT